MNQQSLMAAEIVSKCANPDLCTEVLNYSKKLFNTKSIVITESQWLSFVSHVSGMVYRSIHNEKIPAVEKEMFNEVSQDSIAMASIVCSQLSNLQDDEKYLLSIHFEAAKLN